MLKIGVTISFLSTFPSVILTHCSMRFSLCSPDVPRHPEEGHSGSGGDVRRDGPHLHRLPEQPGAHPLGKLCLPFSQNPGFLGQGLGSQDHLHPGLEENANIYHVWVV